MLFKAANPKGKNQETRKLLKQKVMLLCYQMVALKNKQISGTKTAIGLFMMGSGTSTNGINTLANIGISSTYQTIYNKLEKIANEHEFTVKNYVNNFVIKLFYIFIYLIFITCNKLIQISVTKFINCQYR